MAIKGVTDVVRLPRLGKIRLGVKVQGERSAYPRPVDYFVCPDEVRQVFGEKPKELRILFPTEDETRWASQFYRCYSQTRGLICKGDGERANALIDEETGALADKNSKKTSLKEMECDPEHCPYFGKQCRMVMNLQFLLPDVPGLGVWQLDTSSFWGITNINNGIRMVRTACGRVSMIPLLLKLVPQEVQPNGMRKTVHVLNLDTPYTLIEMLKYAQMPPSKAILPAPDTEPPEDLFPPQVLAEGDGDQPPVELRAGSEEEEGDAPSEPAYEDEQEQPEPDEPVLRNLGDFFQACYRRYGMAPSQVLKELRLSSTEEIADVRDAWEWMRAIREGVKGVE